MPKAIPDFLCSWAEQHGFDCSDINSRIDNATTPLMQAAIQGDISIVKSLIDAGAEVNYVNADDNNALWFACVSNSPEIVLQLVEAGCNINNQNVNGATCLIYASSAGKFEIVKTLVQAQADISCKTLDGFNALDSATTLPILKYLKPVYAS